MSPARWFHLYVAGSLVAVSAVALLMALLVSTARSWPWWQARRDAEQRRLWQKYGRVS